VIRARTLRAAQLEKKAEKGAHGHTENIKDGTSK